MTTCSRKKYEESSREDWTRAGHKALTPGTQLSLVQICLPLVQGKLPESIGDSEILSLSEEIEWQAHESLKSGDIREDQRQAYYKTASQILLETVMKHRPANTELEACSSLQLPELEPLSAMKPHVARPPMDPR